MQLETQSFSKPTQVPLIMAREATRLRAQLTLFARRHLATKRHRPIKVSDHTTPIVDGLSMSKWRKWSKRVAVYNCLNNSKRMRAAAHRNLDLIMLKVPR